MSDLYFGNPRMLAKHRDLANRMCELSREINKTTPFDAEDSIFLAQTINRINEIGMGKNCIEYWHLEKVKAFHGIDLDQYIDEPIGGGSDS